MAKRGESGLSLLVGVTKPVGMSSHDVVNRCRRIFAERRVGHTGTLDPLASGVLPVCVGPATRLDAFMVGHDKRYRVKVAFGLSTTTDDAAGEVVESAPAPTHLSDEEFARSETAKLVGAHDQVPPAYSAIKVDGQRAYLLARSGKDVELKARRIEVYGAELLSVGYLESNGLPTWDIELHVSKGTYIRSLARDLGSAIGCPAYVAALERTAAGDIALAECVSLESLGDLGAQAAIDPVRVLGFRFAFADGDARFVNAGNALRESQVRLFAAESLRRPQESCACTSGIVESHEPPANGELASIVVENRLKAVYRFDAARALWKPECVFSTPILRG